MAASTLKSHSHPGWMFLTLLVASCILILTHIPPEDVPRILQVPIPDKVKHLAAYGLITGFFLLSLRRPVCPASPLLTGLAALAVLGALDETTQPLVNRTCDLWDYLADLTGIALACSISLLLKLSRFPDVLS
jgi:hypothetical protein